MINYFWSTSPVVEEEVKKVEQEIDSPNHGMSFKEPEVEEVEGERMLLPREKHDNIALVFPCESGKMGNGTKMIETVVNTLQN